MKQISKNELQSHQNTPGDGWYIIEAAGQHPAVSKKGHEYIQNLTPRGAGGVVIV